MAIERKIGRHVYRCDKVPATEGLSLFLRASKFFRAAPEMLNSIIEGGQDGRNAFLVLCLSGDLDADETNGFIAELVGLCTAGGDPCVIGVKPEAMQDVVAVAWLALEAQFKDFLAGSLALG
jgi:hypothetical protein